LEAVRGTQWGTKIRLILHDDVERTASKQTANFTIILLFKFNKEPRFEVGVDGSAIRAELIKNPEA